MVVRYPLTGPGQRNDQMVRAVGSLLGRGHSVELVAAVLAGWNEHFQGVMQTGLEEANQAVAACIRSTLRNPEFEVNTESQFLEICKNLQLKPSLQSLLKAFITEDPLPQGSLCWPIPPALCAPIKVSFR
jgi:hypothetical protein